MPISNYPGGFMYGLTVQNLPILNTYGNKIYWVHSGTGSDGNAGTFVRPLASINTAINKCSAGRGDIVMVKAGHAETVSAAGGITHGIAGVQVFGLGTGSAAPTVTFATSTAATYAVTAANAYVRNLRFRCNIASQVTMIDVQSTDCTVEGCDFAEGSATGLSFIAVTGSANGADRLRILGNRFYAPTAGNYNHAIGINEVNDAVEVRDNQIYGNFALSGLHNITGKVLTNLRVLTNYIRNLTAAKIAMNLISACTGIATNNNFISGDATVPAAVFGSLKTSGNKSENNDLEAGSILNLVKTGVVSSTVTQVGVDLTAVSTNGALAIEDIVVQSAATGLAGGTNFTITMNNASGAATIFAETVANLGANKTVDLTSASVTKTRSVIEVGKKLTLKSTVADCTGTGTIDIYIKLRRLSAAANIN